MSETVKVDTTSNAGVVSGPSSLVVPAVTVTENKTAEMLSLEQLVKAGKIENEVEIASIKFKLITLSSIENADVISATSNIKEDDQKFSTLRYEVLARAIESVNGVPLESLYKGQETSKIRQKDAILKLLQQTVINSLWKAYDDMVEESAKLTKVEGAALKN